MTKQIAIAVLCIGALLGLTAPAHADTITPPSTSSYDSPDGYDYVTTVPADGYYEVIGTFTFAIPPGTNVTGITISGTFGNEDGNFTTALSDYYLGFAGDETAVKVAGCDSILANCYSNPDADNSWSTTLTAAQIATLAPGLASGSLDFTFTWDSSPPAQPIPDPLTLLFGGSGYDVQYVYAGPATLNITTPEPAAVLLCFTGLAGLAAFRRFRKP